MRLDSLKIHNLYAVKGTPLAEQVERDGVPLLGRDEYVQVLVDFLELLPPTMVIERLGGDAPREFLVAPAWCLDKSALRAAVTAEFERRDSWQGSRWTPDPAVNCVNPGGGSSGSLVSCARKLLRLSFAGS